MADPTLVAVLIDCDNISQRYVDRILAEAATHGTVIIRRAYGDWHSQLLDGWRQVLTRHAIQPIHQPAYVVGKNATDSALIIDAMDLLYADNVGVFCLVSSDSDFTRLAMRLRESARRVFGIGSRAAANSFQKACDRFTWLELINDGPAAGMAQAGPAGTATPVVPGATGPTPDVVDGAVAQSRGSLETEADAGEPSIADSVPPLHKVLIPAVRAKMNDQGWALLALVGQYVVRVNPTFDSRAYGFDKLNELVRAQQFLEVTERPDANGMHHVWLRVKPSPSDLANRGK